LIRNLATSKAKVGATVGRLSREARLGFQRQRNWLHRHDFIIGMWFSVLVLIGGFALAIYDFTVSARQQDQKIQSTTLHRELLDFFLGTREPDGSSLLENPKEFTKDNRPLQVVTLKRPFFGYFLTKSNFKTFQTEALRFSAPRACELEFAANDRSGGDDEQTIRACFAAIQGDGSGRFVYFSVRYVNSALQRHKVGRPLKEGDRLVLNFEGSRNVNLFLVPEIPPQIDSLNAQKAKRFEGLHEMAAFLADDVGRPTRYVNAQAFEHAKEGSSQRTVTVLGRIDASLLLPLSDNIGVWPSEEIKSVRIGIQVLPPANNLAAKPRGFDPGTSGRAGMSLERVYKTAVQSRAELVVTALAEEKGTPALWRSVDIEDLNPLKPQGLFQRFGGVMADVLVASKSKVRVERQQILSGLPPLSASMSTDAIVVPDIAARALGWLFAGALVILLLIFGAFYVSRRMRRLTRAAYKAASQHTAELMPYAKARDQIGSLGRSLHVLYVRDRNHMARNHARIVRDAQQREADTRKERDYVERRKSILLAIGHQINTPLANLMARIKPDRQEYRELLQMERAVKTLYAANQVEDGLHQGNVVVDVGDIAAYLSSMAEGYKDRTEPVKYEGPSDGVIALFDDIQFQGVIEELINNALRYAFTGTDVVIRLTSATPVVTIEVFNQGPAIQDTKSIFGLGVSDATGTSNMGFGLYAAKAYLSAMDGEIRAENRSGGVAFVMTLPPA
jgi:signal transduction histidine kinase